MAEQDTNILADYDTWLSFPVATRAEILGTSIMLSQTDPASMSDGQWFALGLALSDKDAVAFVNAASIQENGAWDFEDAATYEAAVSAYRQLEKEVGGAKSRAAQQALLDGIDATGRTSMSWGLAAKGFVGGVVAPFVVATAATLPLAGGGLTPAAATAMAGAGPIVTTAARVAPAVTAVGKGSRWMSNTMVGRISSSVADSIFAARSMPVGADQLLKEQILRVGPSGFANMMRIARVGAKYGSMGTATFATSAMTIDTLRALLASEEGLEGDRDVREEQVQVASLEKQGYEVSRDGVILAAGEEFLLADEGVTVKDAEGNIVSAEEIAQVTGEADVPDPFAGENDEAPQFGADVPETEEIYGAADQYRNAPAPSSQDEFMAGLAAVMATAGQSPIDEEPVDYLGIQDREDPFLGGVERGYRRSSYGTDEEMTAQANKWQDMGVPYSVVEAERTHGTPTYRTSDPNREMMNMSDADLRSFQQDAIDAGLIDPESTTAGYFRFGQLDGQTFAAMNSAMAQANVNGENQTWQDALDGMIVNREAYMEKYGDGSEAPPTWSPPRAYFAPDYASISQTVKAQFGRELGRDPNGWEMELLADQFRADHRAQYDAEMAGHRAAFEADGRAQESGIVETPADQQEIDPVARMQESFDTTFSDELDAKSRWADVRSKSRNLFGSLNKLGGA